MARYKPNSENVSYPSYRRDYLTDILFRCLAFFQDYGTLLCWGSNELGKQDVPCIFNILPAGNEQFKLVWVSPKFVPLAAAVLSELDCDCSIQRAHNLVLEAAKLDLHFVFAGTVSRSGIKLHRPFFYSTKAALIR